MSTIMACASGENIICKMSQTLKGTHINATPEIPQASSGGDVETNSYSHRRFSAADGSLTPEAIGKSELEPKVGMVFHSEDEAFKFYNSYAKRKGFSVRKDHLSRRKDGSVRGRHYLCSNEGARKEHRTHISKRPRAIERTNCLARIEFKVNRDSEWVVNKFVDEHNHPLASRNEIHMLRSHRNKLPAQHVPNSKKDYIGSIPAQVIDSPAEVACCTENAGSLLKNQSCYLLHTNRLMDLENGDAQFLLNFLKAKQSEDPSFFYAVQLDEKDRVTNFFWADARSMFDYTCFGDTVLFDTTYRADRNGIPFAPFIGTNNYKQIVIFGAALLLDETTESFIWLFRTFMAAVSGRQPKSFLTDNCAAISAAVCMTLPDAHHQFCLWHILHVAAKFVPHILNFDPNFQMDFEHCIYEGCTEDDLKKAWESLMTKYNLTSNSWLEDLYAARQKWSSVYCKLSFSANMRTKQWNERMENHYGMLFDKNLPLSEFMIQYHKALIQLREEELFEDYESRQTKPNLLVAIPMLIEASESYTGILYKEFEGEYRSHLACLCDPISKDGTIHTFRVSFTQKQSFEHVEYNPSKVCVTCSCRKFETVGILCMHALKVLNYNNIIQLPSHYILKRWTKYAKDGIFSDRNQPVIYSNSRELVAIRYSQVIRKAITVAVKSAFSKDALQVVECGLDKFIAEMESALHNASSNKQINDVKIVQSS